MCFEFIWLRSQVQNFKTVGLNCYHLTLLCLLKKIGQNWCFEDKLVWAEKNGKNLKQTRKKTFKSNIPLLGEPYTQGHSSFCLRQHSRYSARLLTRKSWVRSSLWSPVAYRLGQCDRLRNKSGSPRSNKANQGNKGDETKTTAVEWTKRTNECIIWCISIPVETD